MAWQSVELTNFRSYESASFRLHPRLSLVVGKNGSGKTNLLESLYLASTSRSWRAPDRALVCHGHDFYKVTVSGTQTAEVRYQNHIKELRLNQRRTKVENYIGKLPTVLFEPGSLEISYGAPESRRRFLNSVLVTVNRSYFRQLVSYRRVLKQRNALLRQQSGLSLKNQVFAWDIKLVELASGLVKGRQHFSNFLQTRLAQLYEAITNHPTSLEVRYHSNVETNNDYPARLLEALSSNLERDRLLGSTSTGPHRDDLVIEFKNRRLVAVASRGELRSVTLALKLAELEYVSLHSHQAPLLLLDDVLSELDLERQSFLLQQIKNLQSVITTTDVKSIKTKLPQKHQLIKL